MLRLTATPEQLRPIADIQRLHGCRNAAFKDYGDVAIIKYLM